MLKSLIEVLESPNFGHVATFAIKFESHNKTLFVTSWRQIITSYHFFQNIFSLREPSRVIFPDINKIVTVLLKKNFKDSEKLRE